jgi:hypothetical protein
VSPSRIEADLKRAPGGPDDLTVSRDRSYVTLSKEIRQLREERLLLLRTEAAKPARQVGSSSPSGRAACHTPGSIDCEPPCWSSRRKSCVFAHTRCPVIPDPHRRVSLSAAGAERIPHGRHV